ncbi:homeodomain-interacting protein kinase 4-like [Chanos chanos]|uniref:Homeodomain-interacting protein kinase 4-like n=1 Tax=Chanos chanos TaxID=29144 RepID=A0A6J2UL76_CHACN|nr:homeodomain-interacting protein kinase 4 [Chanos chanos]
MADIYSETEVYHTLDVIGKGTFGKVLKCWRGSDGELVAVKVMKSDAHKSRVIKNELKLIGALSKTNLENSHIVQFYEAFRDQSHHYLVFEMLEKNLYQFQKENGYRPLSILNIRTITCQILRALVKLKELGIIHADLKPENVMIVDQLRYPFRIKLIDFGSANIFNEVRFVKDPYIQSRFYRSPEIILGLPFCEKVDMWSLGCVMAEMFLGWPLYPGESEFDQICNICETQGLPHPHLLNSASKTNLYFQLVRNNCGGITWQLKPKRNTCSGTATKLTQGKDGTSERRKYIFTSLDNLCSINVTERDPTFHPEDLVAETVDKEFMVGLIKRMLTLDSHQRINPSSALRHHFMTMQHLCIDSDSQHYYQMSLQALQKALILGRAGNTAMTCYPTTEQQSLAHGKETGAPWAEQVHIHKSTDTYQACLDGDHFQRKACIEANYIQDAHTDTYPPCIEGYHANNHSETCTIEKPAERTLQHNPSAGLVQSTTEQLENLCLKAGANQEPSAVVWPETKMTDLHVPAEVVPKIKACQPFCDSNLPDSVEGLHMPWSCDGDDSLTSSMLAYINSLEGGQHGPRLKAAHRSCSGPTSGPQNESFFQENSGNPQGIKQAQLAPHTLLNSDLCPAGDLFNSSDILTADGLLSPQDLTDQIEQAGQALCNYAETEGVHFVPYEQEVCPCPHTQWPRVINWTSDPEVVPLLHYGPSDCSSTSQENFLQY